MDNIPYFLQPNESVQPMEFGKVDLFDFNTPEAEYIDPSLSVWSRLSQNIDQTGDYVWNSATGAWESAKGVVTGVVSDIKAEIGEGYSFFKSEIFMWLGVALIVIWVIAKSGIVKQAAAFVL